jgi:uncharacterized membrane protein YbhN (UPF0104 family)
MNAELWATISTIAARTIRMIDPARDLLRMLLNGLISRTKRRRRIAVGPSHQHAKLARRHPAAATWRRFSVALLLGIFIVCLLLAVPSLRGVLPAIEHMHADWLVAAAMLEIASCAAFVSVFRLFFETIPGKQARRVAWAEIGSGALLPGGGVGGLAVGGWLMHLTGMSARRIVRRSSALYFLTTAANVAAVVVAGTLLATGLSAGHAGFVHATLPVVVGCLALMIVLALPVREERRAARPHRSGWITDFVAGISDAERALLRPSWRLWGAVGYLGFDIAVLWCTFAAVGLTPRIAPLVLAYNIGYLADVIPVPGGVGVLDAGLVGTLILYGFPATDAAAAVLVYHSIAFWIPSLGGLLSLTLLRPGISNHALQAPEARPGLG